MSIKGLRGLLFDMMPEGVFAPHVKKYLKKKYRCPVTRRWMGFAIVVFRDKEESRLGQEKLNGAEVTCCGESWTLRAQTAEEDRSSAKLKLGANAQQSKNYIESLCTAGSDPDVIKQILPLSDAELAERKAQRQEHGMAPLSSSSSAFGEGEDDDDGSLEGVQLRAFYRKDEDENRKDLLMWLRKSYGEHPRTELRSEGVLLPEPFQASLLEALRATKFPPVSLRKGVMSEKYFIMRQNNSQDYLSLRDACHDFMQWVDPNYHYTAVAVTKNFIGSKLNCRLLLFSRVQF